MIIEIQQVKTSRSSNEYKCYYKQENICDVINPCSIAKSEYFINFKKTGKKLKLYWNNFDKSFGKNLIDRFTMHILEDETKIGGITGKTEEYGAYNVEYNNLKYNTYIADKGMEGSYLCVYDANNNLVAEIHRPYHDTNGIYDYYRAFTNQEELQELLCLLAIHLDFIMFSGNLMEITNASGHRNGDKYHNEQFVNEIALREGFDLNKTKVDCFNQPVEVEVSNEVTRKVEKKRIITKIIYIIFVIIFLIYFIKGIIVGM